MKIASKSKKKCVCNASVLLHRQLNLSQAKKQVTFNMDSYGHGTYLDDTTVLLSTEAFIFASFTDNFAGVVKRPSSYCLKNLLRSPFESIHREWNCNLRVTSPWQNWSLNPGWLDRLELLFFLLKQITIQFINHTGSIMMEKLKVSRSKMIVKSK